MITVSFTNLRLVDGLLLPVAGCKSFRLVLSGHSGRGVKGDDVICAAVSAIAHTAVASAAKFGGVEHRVTEKDGLLDVEFDESLVNGSGSGSAQLALNFLFTGIFEIHSKYPGTIDLKFD